MFNKSAEFYDLVYSFKDYESEARKIRDLIHARHPAAKSILDVGCGTGEHARCLSPYFETDGIDLQPEFVEVAKRKLPARHFHVADMRTFSVPGRYDVVQCLFSSIGYLTDPADVVRALIRFKEHLNPGGIVIVEPWFTPDAYHPGTPHMAPPVDKPDLKLVRMNVSEKAGRISILHMHYLMARPEGVEHFEERHELGLYTVDEMKSFFAQAGLAADYDPEGIFGRGLYVARRA